MRHPAVTLLVAAAMAATQARGASLREQLAMAGEDQDLLAQIEIVRRIIASEPEDPALRRQLVELWLGVEDARMAQAALDEWKSAPDDFRQKAQARIMEQDGRTKEAAGVLERYLATNPADLQAVAMLAGYYRDLDENQKAVSLLSSEAASRDANLLLVRADARRSLGDFDGALRDFQSAKARGGAEDPARAAPYERLAQAAAKIKAADAQFERDPGDWVAALSAAWLREYVGAQAPEISRFSEAAWKANPGAAAAKIYYAKHTSDGARKAGRLGVNTAAPQPAPGNFEALLQADQAVQKNPDDAMALVRRARALAYVQQPGLALADANAAAALAPKSAEVQANRIQATAMARELPKAEALLPALEKLDPPPAMLAAVHQTLAEAGMRDYRFDFGLEHATAAIGIKPTARLLQLRAAILERMGRSAEAKEDLAAAKKLK